MAVNRNNTVRSYISIGSALSFLVLFVSGTALYTAPPCSVANAIGWNFLLLSKEMWEGVHISFAVVFIILASLHFVYNWNVFATYFRKKTEESNSAPHAYLMVIILTAVLFLLSAFHVPPVSWLHDAHEKIKFSWDSDGGKGREGGMRGKGIRKFLNKQKGIPDLSR